MCLMTCFNIHAGVLSLFDKVYSIFI